ncbi:MAG: putative periplasmic serine endoprotease DegP-like precursor [Candidatus Hydrogenedentes bacterium ADurb.Bin101]|mgnify:CR=1 FL=1|jgi:serine protease Do|nr:MAG: putative periplasmic serine endoprotease DegP-like precursor [Candidatus Hydrogenedentes bacterium ADurb.Bin101]HOC67211.1 PDZ domain-containing protein [Candidatus Hydrogenedentota bacterium]
MTRIVILSFWVVATSVISGSLAFAQSEANTSTLTTPSDLAESIKAAVGQVTPALVRIDVVEAYYRNGREMKSEASGSGVVITQEGHIITNHHVAGHAKQLKCVFSDKSEYGAELVGTDPLTDISIIKLQTDGTKIFPVVPWGDSAAVRVGDHVLAMGSPLALSQSVTLGIISNTEMTMPEWMSRDGGLTIDGEDVGALVRWLAHDAQIFGGNSGGPLVNIQGEVVGINEIRLGLSGAIPSNLARDVADEIISNGKIRRAWVGIIVQPRLKSDIHESGALVSSIIPGSPADLAGLSSGDLLLSVNNVPVDIRFLVQIPDFNLLISCLPIGDAAVFTVDRSGENLQVNITPVERETYELQQFEQIYWGITVRDMSFVMAQERKRKTTEGVLVTSVQSGGPAGDARPDIEADDILVEVNGRPVTNVQSFREITEELMRDSKDPRPVLTKFERKNDLLLTVVKVGVRPLTEPGMEVKKAWLPVEYQVITRDIAEALGHPDMNGFRITQVYADSTAARAGLLEGDLIVSVDGDAMTASSPEHHEELSALIRQYASGDTVELGIRRNQEELKLPVTLSEAPKLAREMKKYQDEIFEFTVRDITFFDRATEKWKLEQTGVLVEQVLPGGWAGLGQLSASDLIVAIDQQPVNTVDDVRAKMTSITESAQAYVVFKVRRGIRILYLELEPKWDKE